MFRLRLSEENSDDLFRKAVLLSLLLHIGFWAGFALMHFLESPPETVMIDLTQPLHIGNPLLKPGGGSRTDKPKTPGPRPLLEPQQVPQAKPEPPKEWVLPGPKAKIEQPKPEAPPPLATPTGVPGAIGEGEQGKTLGSGGGAGEGGGVFVTQRPMLLNIDEIRQYTLDHYPVSEKVKLHEANVVADIGISAEGRVLSVEIIQSAGSEFDAVAKKAALRMKFSPAMNGTQAIAVKIAYPVHFRLGEE